MHTQLMGGWIQATPDCVPVAIMRAFEHAWRRWSLRLEVETMMNLTARTLRFALNMDPSACEMSSLTPSRTVADDAMFWVKRITTI